MPPITDQSFTLRIPIHRDSYRILADWDRWQAELEQAKLPYETRVLAEAQVAPSLWAKLTVFTIGSGGNEVWIDLASSQPSITEIVVGRALLRAFAADSSERRRLLSCLLIHFAVLEYSDNTGPSNWRSPAQGDDIGAALVGGSVVASPTLWQAIRLDLEQSRPSTVIGLRDIGGLLFARQRDGFATMPMDFGALDAGSHLFSLAPRWRGLLGQFSAKQGYRWIANCYANVPELATSKFLSTMMRFGEERSQYRDIPDRLSDYELPVYYPASSSALPPLAKAGLLPIYPGIFWDVSGTRGGDLLTTAGFAHSNYGAFGLTAFATSDDPTRRANFLLAATSAVLVAAASGKIWHL